MMMQMLMKKSTYHNQFFDCHKQYYSLIASILIKNYEFIQNTLRSNVIQ